MTIFFIFRKVLHTRVFFRFTKIEDFRHSVICPLFLFRVQNPDIFSQDADYPSLCGNAVLLQLLL